MDLKHMKRETKITYADPCKATGSHIQPLYQTSTFVFDSAEQGAARFAGEEPGYIYSRLGNPTVRCLEEKMALLEDGEDATIYGSGMAAVSASILAFVEQGDHIVAQQCLYGCTHSFLSEIVKKWGIEVTFISDASNPENFKNAMRPNTKIVYIESPANPAMQLTDIKACADIAHGNNARLIVDNTFMTPYLQRPLNLGADIVLHSATKYLNGHGDVVAGILVGSKEDMDTIRMTTQKDLGGITSPFDAWLMQRGIKTLAIRMKEHEKNAMEVAKFLESHPKVKTTFYPGLPSHPQHELAKTQAEGFGGMIAFELKGGLEAGKVLMNNIEIFHLAVSLGTVDSLIQHPASMTHSPVPEEERWAAGITDGLVRVSVGIENVEDLIAALDRALKLV